MIEIVIWAQLPLDSCVHVYTKYPQIKLWIVK